MPAKIGRGPASTGVGRPSQLYRNLLPIVLPTGSGADDPPLAFGRRRGDRHRDDEQLGIVKGLGQPDQRNIAQEPTAAVLRVRVPVAGNDFSIALGA